MSDRLKAKLTPRGEALAAKLKKEREENIAINGGEYKPKPWYYVYFSKDFVPSASAQTNESDADTELQDKIGSMMGAKKRSSKTEENSEELLVKE